MRRRYDVAMRSRNSPSVAVAASAKSTSATSSALSALNDLRRPHDGDYPFFGATSALLVTRVKTSKAGDRSDCGAAESDFVRRRNGDNSSCMRVDKMRTRLKNSRPPTDLARSWRPIEQNANERGVLSLVADTAADENR